jgi:hypothetical protein
MYLRIKEVAPDRGKNSFRDFIIDDAGLKPHVDSPKTGSKNPEIKLPSLTYEQTNRKFKDMISTTKCGNTWDVRHLDRFLRTSKYAKPIDSRSQSTHFLGKKEEEELGLRTSNEKSFGSAIIKISLV